MAELRGTVTLRARIKGEGLQFDACEFSTNIYGVETSIVESQEGHEILATVRFAAVAAEADGKSVASIITTTALDRPSLTWRLTKAEITESQFLSERKCAHFFSPRLTMRGLMGRTLGYFLGGIGN